VLHELRKKKEKARKSFWIFFFIFNELGPVVPPPPPAEAGAAVRVALCLSDIGLFLGFPGWDPDMGVSWRWAPTGGENARAAVLMALAGRRRRG
jgi:hypothetical protein